MAKLRASGVNPVITTDQSSGTLIAGYYRLVGIDISVPSGATSNTNLVLIGSDTETVAANQPSFITIDRCYLHGIDTGDYRRGAALNGSSPDQRLEIGPLHQNQTGVSYNGMRSTNTYDFTNAAVYVQVVVPPTSANIEEHAMLGAGKDSGNYYRIRISGNTTVAEKRLANGSKVTLATTAYDSTNHQFLRIRHDQASGSVVFEAAPASGGAPGTWTTLVSDTWDTTNVPLSAVAFELKAGTTDPQPQPPGTIAFDNFSATRQ